MLLGEYPLSYQELFTHMPGKSKRPTGKNINLIALRLLQLPHLRERCRALAFECQIHCIY